MVGKPTKCGIWRPTLHRMRQEVNPHPDDPVLNFNFKVKFSLCLIHLPVPQLYSCHILRRNIPKRRKRVAAGWSVVGHILTGALVVILPNWSSFSQDTSFHSMCRIEI